MIQGFFLWLLATFVAGPVQAEWGSRLGAAPALAGHAAAEPWWGISTAVGVWAGTRDGAAVLAQATPGCASAVAAARPLLAAPRL